MTDRNRSRSRSRSSRGGDSGAKSSNAIIEENEFFPNAMVAIVDTHIGGSERKAKDLLCIRHGVSVANEFMSRPDNKWGSPSFRDDPELIDAPLSETGINATKAKLPEQLLHQDDLRSFLVGTITERAAAATNDDIADASDNNGTNSDDYDGVELVLVSPLTRCLQTYMYGVEPVLLELLTKQQGRNRIHHSTDIGDSTIDDDDDDDNGNNYNDNNPPRSKLPIPVLAIPLLRERVYTASDTGRPISVLENEFPSIDFSECHKSLKESRGPNGHKTSGDDDVNADGDDDTWWYTGNEPVADGIDEEYREWRPHGKGQWYAVPGEPRAVFSHRMEKLKEWLSKRKETKILVVAHWGVLKYLTDGVEWKNSEAKIIRLSPRS